MSGSGFAMYKRELREAMDLFERKGGLGLGVLEKTMFLLLPTILNDAGFGRLDLKLVRSRLFPETGVNIRKIELALRKLEKAGLISIFGTGGGKRFVCLDAMLNEQPLEIEMMPSEPMPSWMDCVRLDDGRFKVVTFDRT